MKNYTFFSDHSLFALRFAIPPILTILAGKCLFEMLAFDFPQLNNHLTTYFSTLNEVVPTITSFHESKARLLWLTSVLLYFFVNAGFFTFLWSILKKSTRTELLLLLMIASSFSALEMIYLFKVGPGNSPINNIFRFSFDSLTAAKLLSPATLSIIHYLLNIINFVAIIAVPVGIMAGCCIVSQNVTDIAQVNNQFILLTELVKSSSAIMIAGIIHMQLWLSWPLSLISDFANINELKEVILTIIQYWGICYSLTIAALYLPIAAHFRKKARSFCHPLDSKDSKENSQQQQVASPLIQSATTQIPQIVAILAPMLVGSISPAMTDVFSF